MGKGDVSNLPFEEIAELCQNYSRSRTRSGKRAMTSKITKSTTGNITRAELGNLFEDFKTDLMSTFGNQIDTLKTKKRQDEQEQELSISCLKCKQKHALKECPLDNVQICGFCTENHDIKDCTKMKVLHNSNSEANV